MTERERSKIHMAMGVDYLLLAEDAENLTSAIREFARGAMRTRGEAARVKMADINRLKTRLGQRLAGFELEARR